MPMLCPSIGAVLATPLVIWDDGHLSVLQLVSRHVIENSGDRLKKLRTELRRVVGLIQIPTGNVITCLEPLLNCHFKF